MLILAHLKIATDEKQVDLDVVFALNSGNGLVNIVQFSVATTFNRYLQCLWLYSLNETPSREVNT